MQEYGEERLPAGDLSGNEIIVVEGRADVVNLLKNRVNNVIGMNGTKLPKEIAKIGEKKELTLFIDGDRGGKLIAGNVMNNAKIAYVAVAPDGKEVEELTGKEILLSLRKKMPAEQFANILARNGSSSERYSFRESKGEKEAGNEASEGNESKSFNGDAKETIRKVYENIKGSKNAAILDYNGDVIRKVSNKEVTRSILSSKNQIFAVVIDGQATGASIRACDERNVAYCAATSFGSVTGEEKVKLISI